MRRLTVVFAAGALWLFLLAIPALADNGPHTKGAFGATPDACAGCHRTHSAVEPDLLLNTMPALCYTCHGAGVTGAQTDAQDGALYSVGANHAGVASGALRGGGFDHALIASDTYSGSGFGGLAIGARGVGAANTATTSFHSVDGSPQTMWGNGAISATANSGEANVAMTCGSCHDPHGNGQYRILKPGPSDSGIANESFQTGYANGGRVYINDGASKIYSTTNYGNVQVSVTTESALNPTVDGGAGAALWYSPTTKNWYGSYTETSSRWCQTCHTRYMAPTNAASASSGDAIFAFRHAVKNIVDPTNSGIEKSGDAIFDVRHAVKNIVDPANTGATALSVASMPDTLAAGTVITPLTAGLGAGVAPYTANGVGTGGTAHLDKLTFSAPKCITCHTSHGSNALMTSVITTQSSPLNAAPAPYLDSTLLRLDNRGMCEACHAK